MMAIRKYYQQALEKCRYVFKKRYVVGFLAGAMVILLLLRLQPFTEPVADAETILHLQLTDLPQLMEDPDTYTTLVRVVDTQTSRVLFIEAFTGLPPSYDVETTPGYRMVFVAAADGVGNDVYSAKSEARRIEEGATYRIDIRRSVETTFIPNVVHAAGPKPTFGIMVDKANTYWAQDGPMMRALLDGYKTSYNRRSPNFDNINIVGLSNDVSTALDQEYELMRQGLIRQEDVHEYTPYDPNFIIKVKGNVIKKPLYPNSARLETYDTTEYEITMIDVASGKIIGSGQYKEAFVDDWDFVKKAAADFVDRIIDQGRSDAITLTEFTESVPVPIKKLPSEHAQKFIDIVNKAVPEVTSGGAGTKHGGEGSGGERKAPTCNFNGFVACRDKFNLQGCIDACPMVSKPCPQGSSPDTECSQTDEACSNDCWNKGNSHGSQCAAINHCSMQEVEEKLRAQ